MLCRFGLYGLPFERTIFDIEGPVLGKSTATPVTYTSVLVGDTAAGVIAPPKPDYQLKDLYNFAGDIGMIFLNIIMIMAYIYSTDLCVDCSYPDLATYSHLPLEIGVQIIVHWKSLSCPYRMDNSMGTS